MLVTEALDEGQRLAQALREHELRVFAALDASLDELDEAENIMVELVFFEQPFDSPQLIDRKREARYGRLRPARTRPVEIEVRSLVVARRLYVVSAGPEMTVAGEELSLGLAREIPPDA